MDAESIGAQEIGYRLPHLIVISSSDADLGGAVSIEAKMEIHWSGVYDHGAPKSSTLSTDMVSSTKPFAKCLQPR
jgi:hypothetical protein